MEGQAVGAVLGGYRGPKLTDVSPVFKTLDARWLRASVAGCTPEASKPSL